MSVQARFYVAKITQHAYNPEAVQVELQAVCRGPENKSWAAATPSGMVNLTINNESAAKWFMERLSKDVAITFEDRPLLCVVCGKETTLYGPDSGYDLSSDIADLKTGQHVHGSCANELHEKSRQS